MKTTKSNSSDSVFTARHPGIATQGEANFSSSNDLVSSYGHPKLSHIPIRIVNGIIIVEPMEEDGSEVLESPSSNAAVNEGAHNPTSVGRRGLFELEMPLELICKHNGEDSDPNQKFLCNYCDYSCTIHDEYVKHLKGHLFTCTECDFSAADKCTLFSHNSDKHPCDAEAKLKQYFPVTKGEENFSQTMSAQERQNTHGHRFIPYETRNKESDSRANGSQRTSQETIQIGRNTAKTEKKSQVLYFDDIKRNSVGKSAIFPKRKKEVIEIIDVDSLPDEPTSGQLYSSSGSNPISVPFKRFYTMINWQCKMCSKRFSDEWEAIKHSSDAHKRVFTESHFIKEFRYSKSEPVKKNISHLEPR